MAELTYEILSDAVGGSGVALRVSRRLQPAGGPGTTVAPPTYSTSARTKYALEGPRPLEGEDVRTATRYARVLLDSVASQANRMEESLQEGWELGELNFPVPFVDFSHIEELRDLDRITVLQAPHRIADAIFRDSLLDGTLFRLSDMGKAMTEARPQDAAGLYATCPHALVFGQWDSTGPKGGLGSKFQRALVSEIVGHEVELGVKVGSRIDPLQIEKASARILQAKDADEEWTLDPDQAKTKSGKPMDFDRGGNAEEKGRPSQINHGNVTPSIDAQAGGVVIDHAVQTAVLSLATLRKLRFPTTPTGEPVLREVQRDTERAVRTSLAALGVAAMAYQAEMDHDLRSRCLLVPEQPGKLELLSARGNDPQHFELSIDNAQALLAEATDQAAQKGFAWPTEDIRLEPAPKFVELIMRSRDLLIKGEGEE